MSVRKTVNQRISVIVARTGIPAVDTRIRRRLNHSVWHNRAGERVAMATGSYHRVNKRSIICRSIGLMARHKNQARKTQRHSSHCNKQTFSHQYIVKIFSVFYLTSANVAISNSSSPPAMISSWVINVRSSGLPLSLTLLK